MNRNNLFLKFIFFVIFLIILKVPTQAEPRFFYKLYKNQENFGVVVFPSPEKDSPLVKFIESLDFHFVEIGGAVFRNGSKRENGTFMMPESTQEKHNIQKFIIVQVLNQWSFLIGIFHPEHGLTLPQLKYTLKDLKKNFPKTLNIFRGFGFSTEKALENFF